MDLELVIDADPPEVSIALLQDKVLTELHREKSDTEFSVGDMYLGRVKKVIPSLNAAFVDVGYKRDAFLHYLDLGPQFSSLKKFVKLANQGKLNKAGLAGFKMESDIDKNGKMQDQAKADQNILVQVAKEPISQKGPRLTSELTIAGRFLVLVPFTNKISISQSISSKDERNRLRRLLKSIKPENFGVIIRTVAQDKKASDLDQDLRDLIKRWDICFQELQGAKPPKKVLGELDRTSALLRDMLNGEFTRIHVNNNEIYGEVKDYIESISPDQKDIVKPYSGKVDIFDKFGIQKQIKASFGRHVPLRSGAYLIVEHTEAMHVIDVNSGNRRSPEKSQEENALEVNLEAAQEVARLLKLRDMGGIICVDFIDMYDKANQKKLYEGFKKFLEEDKAKHNVLFPSKFGVIEITRERVRPETDIKTAEKCPVCDGKGEVQATVLITDDIENHLRYLFEEQGYKKLTVEAHPFIAAYLEKGWPSIKWKWIKRFKKKLRVVPKTAFHFLQFRFIDTLSGEEIEV